MSNYPAGVDDNDDYFSLPSVEENINNGEQWGCRFPTRCLLPNSRHLKSECYTVEVIEEAKEFWGRGVTDDCR